MCGGNRFRSTSLKWASGITTRSASRTVIYSFAMKLITIISCHIFVISLNELYHSPLPARFYDSALCFCFGKFSKQSVKFDLCALRFNVSRYEIHATAVTLIKNFQLYIQIYRTLNFVSEQKFNRQEKLWVWSTQLTSLLFSNVHSHTRELMALKSWLLLSRFSYKKSRIFLWIAQHLEIELE